MVINSNTIAEVITHVEENTLVIFDIDGVIMEPVQMLGSDPWAYYEGDKYIAIHGGNVAKGLEAFAPVWIKVQEKVSVRTVDKKLALVLKMLKDFGNSVIGFTARGIALAKRTKEQLQSIDIDLSNNSFFSENLVCPSYLFDNGILFTKVGYNKGECLKCFFKKIKKRPPKIVFIDDHEKNIESMKKMCSEEKISYVGILYKGASYTKETFDPKVSDMQLEYLDSFAPILTDKEARELLGIKGEIEKTFASL